MTAYNHTLKKFALDYLTLRGAEENIWFNLNHKQASVHAFYAATKVNLYYYIIPITKIMQL